MTLDEAIKQAAAKGQLNHLSIIAHADRHGQVTFRAMFRNVTGNGNTTAENADPVRALLEALKNQPERAPRAAKPKGDDYDFG